MCSTARLERLRSTHHSWDGQNPGAARHNLSVLFSLRRSFRYHARMVERTLAIIKPDAVSRHLVVVGEGEAATRRRGDRWGATDPANAAKGTIRKTYGTHIEHNAVHGSDSAETAQFELSFFFSTLESPQR